MVLPLNHSSKPAIFRPPVSKATQGVESTSLCSTEDCLFPPHPSYLRKSRPHLYKQIFIMQQFLKGHVCRSFALVLALCLPFGSEVALAATNPSSQSGSFLFQISGELKSLESQVAQFLTSIPSQQATPTQQASILSKFQNQLQGIQVRLAESTAPTGGLVLGASTQAITPLRTLSNNNLPAAF